jgi:hypothetical protein
LSLYLLHCYNSYFLSYDYNEIIDKADVLEKGWPFFELGFYSFLYQAEENDCRDNS